MVAGDFELIRIINHESGLRYSVNTESPQMSSTYHQAVPRPASRDDAEDMARLVNIAGEGLPLYLWQKMAEPGESPWQVGRNRAMRDEGGFSWRNSHVIGSAGRIVAGLVGYLLNTPAEPSDYASMPPLFVPLQQLEDEVPGTWYVNVLATLPEYRGQGLGSRLLALADELAEKEGASGLSIIVSNANTGAARLYERHGYGERDRRPMVKEGWSNPGTEWVLLAKPSRRCA